MLIYTSRKEVTSTRNEIKKTFEIPAGVSRPESITSVIGKDGNLTISAKVDNELVRQQQLQETTKKSVTTISNTSNTTNEVLIRIRTVNTTKNVTGQDLKDMKIVNDRFEVKIRLKF